MSQLQVPKTPGGLPASIRQWFDAVGKTLQGFISKGQNGFLTRGELANTGVIGIGGDGTATAPGSDVTTPPKVNGLTAEGALASIFLSWDAPTFANLAYVEILRADVDNFGTAYPVGTAVKGINVYKDNVGSGATKYYWVRAVTTAGVKGPANAVSGTKGTTGYDPSYVMQILTSGLWYPSTLYEPYQYVRPSTPSNYQYVCVSGGTSGTVEPTWPTTVGHTVTDGTCTWACEALTARVPFAIGAVDGQPAVSILNAFIQDASITSAKVHDLAADKITAGEIQAIVDIKLGGYLWNGFSNFTNPSNVPGFWFGMSGSTPRFKLSTGAPYNHGITFDGTNLTVSGDGTFDDVFGDSARFNLVSASNILFNNRCVESGYISEHSLTVDNPDYNKYLCVTDEVFKTTASSVTSIGTVYLVFAPTGYFVFDPSNPRSVVIGTPYIASIYAYDHDDVTSVVRFKKHSSFVGKATNVLFGIDGFNYFDLKLYFGTPAAHYIETFDLNAHMAAIGAATVGSPYALTRNSYYNGQPVTISLWGDTGTLYFQCEDTNSALPFLKAQSSSMKAEISYYATYVGSPPFGYAYGTSTGITQQLSLQLWKPQYTPVSTVTTDARLY